MSEVTSGTNQPLQSSQSEPQRNASENHPIQITTIRLNGDNFLRWSQSVRMYLRGRGKIGYITGDSKQPDVNDNTYAIWEDKCKLPVLLYSQGIMGQCFRNVL